jgi:hemoglobin
MAESTIPTLYEWAGGMPAFERLTSSFYQKVLADPLLQPLFQHMLPEHAHYVAQFLAEVFGGPASYSEQRGGHAHMVSEHLNRHLSEPQRAQFVRLLQSAADDAGLPTDPEFRSAFAAYLEWGSRIAVMNSKSGAKPSDPSTPMPHWGWGEVGGPYRG